MKRTTQPLLRELPVYHRLASIRHSYIGTALSYHTSTLKSMPPLAVAQQQARVALFPSLASQRRLADTTG